MSEHIEVVRDGHSLGLRFARPEKRNAITAPMYLALAEALREAEDSSEIRVIVLRGTEGCFTAGNDVGDLLEAPPTEPGAPVMQFLGALAANTVPLVAAVDGDAVGVGTTMLLHCDVVLATPRARFRLPFVDLGFVPEAGSTLLLPRILGYSRAAELALLADFFDGERAHALGIVNRLVAPETLEAETTEIVGRLAAKPPRAMRETKRLMKDGAALDAAIRREADVFAERMVSAEAREAFRAFAEKRKPDFSGLF